MSSAAADLPIMTMARTATTSSGSRTQYRGVEQHADRDEEEDGEGVLQRLRLLESAVAVIGFVEHDAGEESAEREGDAEELGREEGDAEGDGDHGKREELAGAGAGDLIQEERQQPRADHQHEDHEGRDLAEGDCWGGRPPMASHVPD